MTELSDIVEAGWERRAELSSQRADPKLLSAIEESLELLDSGEARVAEPTTEGWVVNEWLKKAVLLSFRISANRLVDGGFTRFFDKVPLKYAKYEQQRFVESGARIVPGAIVRRGAHVAPDAVLMPCFVNIGAYVDSGTMIDTWATVGSCAQIGKNVHLSGGAGIGGVLEPLQASPTIIEDGCFIGARSEIAEGVIVERGSVIAMGVFISQSTPIYDRESGEVIHGRVPAGSVVVSGSRPSRDGKYSLYSAVIVKKVDERTRAKTTLNELLRPSD